MADHWKWGWLGNQDSNRLRSTSLAASQQFLRVIKDFKIEQSYSALQLILTSLWFSFVLFAKQHILALVKHLLPWYYAENKECLKEDLTISPQMLIKTIQLK